MEAEGRKSPFAKLRATRLLVTLAKGSLTAKGGAQRRIRTTDTAIFSRLLYQLSYLGVSG